MFCLHLHTEKIAIIVLCFQYPAVTTPLGIAAKQSMIWSGHQHNYFNLHFCLSIHHLGPMTTVMSQNITDKICLVGIKSEKCAFIVPFRQLGSMRQGKTKIRWLRCLAKQSQAMHIKTHLIVSLPFQCWPQAFVCVSSPRM